MVSEQLLDVLEERRYDSKERVGGNWQQHVYENWKRSEGPCSECPNRLLNTDTYPEFGGGRFDSPLMIVGQESAYGKNRSEDGGAVPEKEAIRDFEGWTLYAEHGYSHRAWEDWGTFPGDLADLFDESVGISTISFEETYYTNAKKCPNIQGRDNDKARDCCRTYLREELQLVEPQVIIACGRKAFKDVVKATDNPNFYSGGSLKSIMTAEEDADHRIAVFESEEPNLSIVLVYHWAYVRSNSSELPWVDDIEDYWCEVASVVESNLEPE